MTLLSLSLSHSPGHQLDPPSARERPATQCHAIAALVHAVEIGLVFHVDEAESGPSRTPGGGWGSGGVDQMPVNLYPRRPVPPTTPESKANSCGPS